MSALGVIGAIDASPLSQRVLTRIRDRILSGALPHGLWLRLTDLAAELGTSVTPVRAALSTLQEQGLVEVAKARGFRVIPPTRRDVTDAYLIAAFLSGELAARAASTISLQTLAQLESLHERMSAVAGGKQSEDIDALNWEFHRTIHLAAESPRAGVTLRAVTRSVPHDFHRLVPGWTEEALLHHKQILDALRSYDAEGARVAAQRHVALGCERLVEHLERTAYWKSS
jgi:DNA-binding GntR family transcriptional regulator